MLKDSSARYYQKKKKRKKERLEIKPVKGIKICLKREYGRERYKILSEDEKQRLGEDRKNML